MLARLARHGIALNADRIVQPALDDPAKSAGRPWVARALVEGGYVATTDEAFERWLEHGKPAFVPRQGPSPAEAFGWIHEAGGLASLAHPGLVGRDDWIRGFAEAGLDAIEAYHTDHDASATQRYLSLAAALQLGVTGGSDFHGDVHGGSKPGGVSLPKDEYDRLVDRWKRRRQPSAG
jgi:predicted metal-dependent phosphoesterase TrpH